MKIFATVGAQMPFDRLIGALDRWAAERPRHRVLAQVGQSALRPAHVEWKPFLTPREFARACEEADALVGHAGTGTLFAAMERSKPILVLPRRAALRETRNDHQVATARRFARFDGVEVAWNEDELPDKLDALASIRGARPLPAEAGGPLIETLMKFLEKC